MSTEPTPDPTSQRPAEPAEPSPVPDHPPSIPEQPIPRGCNPLVFGLVAATIQLALTIYFMRSC